MTDTKLLHELPFPDAIARSGRFSFHAFLPSELEALREAWSGLAIRSGQPSVRDVECCAVMPLRHRGGSVAGVYDASNRLVESSVRMRAGERVGTVLDRDTFPAARDDLRQAYYLGAGEKHYGHFLLEILCRAWAWKDHGGDRVPVLQAAVPAFGRAMLALVPGISERLEIVAKPTRFSRVLVPEASFVIRRQAHAAFKDLCERMADRATESRGPFTEQPLYLSRTGLHRDRRTLVGEEWLEQRLEKDGFRVVRPETLPVREQIVLFNRHRWIVSTIGSACHSRLFARDATNFVTVTPAVFNENHILCDALCKGNSHYVHALTKPEIGASVDLLNVQPFVIDNRLFLTTLREIGLVGPEAENDVPSPDIDDYVRRWLTAARWLAKSNPVLRKALLDDIAAVKNRAGARRTGLSRIFAQKRREESS